MGHGHSHAPVGDPTAASWLWGLVERLEPELAAEDGGSAGAILQEAQATLTRLVHDGNPRTRAQARALLLVGAFVARGERVEAAELLGGELRRSFPGQAEFDPDLIERFLG